MRLARHVSTKLTREGQVGIVPRLGQVWLKVDVTGRVESDDQVTTYTAQAECRDGADGVPHVTVHENRRQWRKKSP